MYTAENATNLLQVVNLTNVLQLVKKFFFNVVNKLSQAMRTHVCCKMSTHFLQLAHFWLCEGQIVFGGMRNYVIKTELFFGGSRPNDANRFCEWLVITKKDNKL